MSMMTSIKKEKKVSRSEKEKRASTDWSGSDSQDCTTDRHSSSYSNSESNKRKIHRKKIALKVISPVNTLLRRTLDYYTYRLDD